MDRKPYEEPELTLLIFESEPILGMSQTDGSGGGNEELPLNFD